jgi:hypothetical protein
MTPSETSTATETLTISPRQSAQLAYDELVQVGGLLGSETAQPEVVEDEQARGEVAPQSLLPGVVGAGLGGALEEGVGAAEEDAPALAGRDVAQRLNAGRLADPDRADQQAVIVPIKEAQREDLVFARRPALFV